MNEKQLLTAERVQAEYQKGVQFNTYLDLYDDVKQCENFVEGKQSLSLVKEQGFPAGKVLFASTCGPSR